MSFHFFIYGKNEVLICLNVEVNHFIIEYICDFITSTLIIWSWWFNWMNRRHYVNILRIHTTKKRNSKIHSRKTLPFFSSNLNLIHIWDFTNIYIYIYINLFKWILRVFWNTSRSSRRYENLSQLKKMIFKSNLENMVLRFFFFLWHAQEILSSVFQLIFLRNDEIQTLLLDNIHYFLNNSFEKWKKNMIIFMISLIICDRLIDFAT